MGILPNSPCRLLDDPVPAEQAPRCFDGDHGGVSGHVGGRLPVGVATSSCAHLDPFRHDVKAVQASLQEGHLVQGLLVAVQLSRSCRLLAPAEVQAQRTGDPLYSFPDLLHSRFIAFPVLLHSRLSALPIHCIPDSVNSRLCALPT